MNEVISFLGAIFQQPFVWGLIIAVAVFFTVWRDGLQKTRDLRRELKTLRDKKRQLHNHIETSMNVGTKDLDAMESKLKNLQTENDNLKEEVEAAKRTDHGQDRRLFHIFVGARVKLATRTPGFAEAWERTVAETEKEIEPDKTGVGRFMKDWVPSGLTRMLPGKAEEGTSAPLRLEQGEAPPPHNHHESNDRAP
ncbi:MAG: hypothetical protein ACFB21_02450 [Opitutales bacterium]